MLNTDKTPKVHFNLVVEADRGEVRKLFKSKSNLASYLTDKRKRSDDVESSCGKPGFENEQRKFI